MIAAAPIDDLARPRLSRGVRLHHDKVRGIWLVLAPESVVDANAIAVEIIRRCSGERQLAEIIDDLAAAFTVDRARVDADVRALLAELACKRMIDL